MVEGCGIIGCGGSVWLVGCSNVFFNSMHLSKHVKGSVMAIGHLFI